MKTQNKKVASAGYLYHGTNEDVLDAISKEGLKPMRRGLLSLSNDEGYANSYARSGMTPQGKTNPVLLRIKNDLLKGKTVASSKPRPMPDQLHEILTKETIPPEALEIKINGQWQPLKSGTTQQSKSSNNWGKWDSEHGKHTMATAGAQKLKQRYGK